MKYIRRLDKKAKRQYAVLTVLFVIGAFMETASIAMVLPFLERFLSRESDPGKVYLMAGIVVLCFLIKNLYLYVIHILKRRFVMTHYRNTAANMLGIYLNEPYSFHVDHNSGTLVNNINIYTVRYFNYLQTVMDLVAELSVAAVLFAYMLTVNFLLSVSACLVFLMVTLLLRKVVYPKLKSLQKESNSAFDRMHVIATQAMHAIKEVKVYGVEEMIGRDYDEKIFINTENNVKMSRLNGLPTRLIELTAVGGMIAFLAFMTASGSEADTLALMAVIALVLVRLMPGVNRINSYLSSLSTYKADLERSDGEFSEVLEKAGRNTSEGHTYIVEERNDTEKIPSGSVYEIVIEDLSFSYGEREIFKDTSMKASRGSTIGLKGPSGEGKSTFMNLLLGLLEPSEGSIYVLSEGKRLPLTSLRIGYIPQDIYIMDSTVKDNVVFFREYDEAKLRRALTLARLDEVVGSLKNGADTRIGERGVRLSGGQNQRIGIARALYDDPDLLLLDEATSSLDNALEKEIMDDVYKLKGGRTIIIAAHRLSTLEDCDTVYEVGNRTVTPEKEIDR